MLRLTALSSASGAFRLRPDRVKNSLLFLLAFEPENAFTFEMALVGAFLWTLDAAQQRIQNEVEIRKNTNEQT